MLMSEKMVDCVFKLEDTIQTSGNRHPAATVRQKRWAKPNETHRRIRYIRSTGACDSFDGTQWAMFRHTYLDAGLDFLLPANQLTLEDVAA